MARGTGSGGGGEEEAEGWFAARDQLALHLAVGYGLNEDKAAKRPPPELEIQTGGWREDPAEGEKEKRRADLLRAINLRFTSPLATG